jgi:hypothetical protein
MSRTPKVLGPRTRRHPSFRLKSHASARNSIVFGTKFACIRIFGAPMASPTRTARPLLLVESYRRRESRIDLTKSEMAAITSY